MLVLFEIHGKFNVVCTLGMITILKKSWGKRERERFFDAAYLTMVVTNNIE